MKTSYLPRFGAALLLAAAAGEASAQVPVTPRALGMGGAYIATARGYESLFVNPANLGLKGTPHWSIAFPQLAASSTLLGARFEDIPSLIDEDLPAGERSAVVDKIPESGTEAQLDVRAPLAVLQVGRFALGVGYGMISQHSFSKDIIELLVDGYEEGRTDYAIGNTGGSRMTYWDFAAGYGQRVGPLSVGVTAHYIRGGSAQRSRMFEPRLDVENRDITVDYVSVIARGGSGYSVDVGAALQPVPSLTVSASVANAFSRMKWSEELQVRDFTLIRSDLDEGFWQLKGLYEGTEKPLDPTAVPLRVFDTAQGLYDKGFFPAVAKAGISWQPTGWTHIAVAGQKNLTEGRLAGRWNQMASVGVQQRIPLIVLRAGYATNMESGSMLSGGASLGPIQVGVARLTDNLSDGTLRSGYIATFGLSVGTKGKME